MAPPAGTIKVVHRQSLNLPRDNGVGPGAWGNRLSMDSADRRGPPEQQQQQQQQPRQQHELEAAVAALEAEKAALQRDLTRASLERDRALEEARRLADECRLHKQGCTRAEDLVRRMSRDGEGAAATKVRLEDHNRRLLEELR
ncbi:hypothetical protein MNEG_9635 [Monoraphidium neglectum]|uniref:Uncharacterized protein n=1 Tax=Monoraphidium neglectum TaxID=145388 RepID=A0A0D2MBT9_9CHLO|nr:hypothetical protein MNEG_9635 [Monoraphidium neglectum]KIY98326.1 hypothetical protein MNEG_9635 [Monoraphidium neglectum]|eukprot:XP_013897346.1 hypothetical protein MNEG_9635 [Monoraphidium neglectum]